VIFNNTKEIYEAGYALIQYGMTEKRQPWRYFDEILVKPYNEVNKVCASLVGNGVVIADIKQFKVGNSFDCSPDSIKQSGE